MNYKLKVAVMGDYATGKTSLVRRYTENSFSDKYLSTIGVKIAKKTVQTEGHSLDALIWDIEGRTGYSSIPARYLGAVDVAVIAIPINQPNAIDCFLSHRDRLLLFSPQAKYVVALTKIDLEEKNQTIANITNGLTESGVTPSRIFPTSSKEGVGVTKVFDFSISYACPEIFLVA